jgi:hypothetical protein
MPATRIWSASREPAKTGLIDALKAAEQVFRSSVVSEAQGRD